MARGKGMGSIRERNGKFSLRLRINGTQLPIKLKATNRADAEKESFQIMQGIKEAYGNCTNPDCTARSVFSIAYKYDITPPT